MVTTPPPVLDDINVPQEGPARKRLRVTSRTAAGRAAMGVMKFRLRHGVEPLNVEMWRKKARKRLPDLAWAYVDGGADDLVTVRENMSGFRQWRLRQKVLTGITKPNLGTKIAGTEVALPLGLAPTGSTGLSHYTGDVAVARAAEAVGTRLCLSGAG